MYHTKKLEILKKALVESHHNNAFLMGVVSSALATIGLATNSQTTLLGAMLLSPIGALLTKNIIYSFLTKQKYKLDTKYEKWFLAVVMVLSITLLISFLIGKVLQKFKNPFTGEKITKDWPTEQMLERADPINAFYMVFIALLCGIALPIALINNSGIKLVAIGIATALIPPIANIGLSLSLKKDTIKDKKYEDNAILTGISIFIINCVLLWLPSKFILPTLTKKNNIIRLIENVFIFPRILLNLKKYRKFIEIDTDGDGFIDPQEYKKHFSNNNKFQKLNTNHSGKLSIREFLEIRK